MKFYHGTTSENFKKIKKEGFLWGTKTYIDENGKSYDRYRYTYLTPDIEIAKQYGDIILEVEYEPTGIKGIDNYCFEDDIPKKERERGAICWQFSVFLPISLKDIKIINNN